MEVITAAFYMVNIFFHFKSSFPQNDSDYFRPQTYINPLLSEPTIRGKGSRIRIIVISIILAGNYILYRKVLFSKSQNRMQLSRDTVAIQRRFSLNDAAEISL